MRRYLTLTGMPQYKFTIAVSALDCTGCGSCANVCPGKKGEKALTMDKLDKHLDEQKTFDYTVTCRSKRMLLLNSKRPLLRVPSSNSRYLSSPAHVLDVVRLRTLS